MQQRVVITGMGAVSPYGQGVDTLWHGLCSGQAALRSMDSSQVQGLACAIGGMVPPVKAKLISRDIRRTMSPMSIHACLAAWEALEQAGIDRAHIAGNAQGEEIESAYRVGISMGTTLGSPQALHDFFYEYITTKSVDSVRSTAFFKVMSHTVASNVAMACGLKGRLLAPSAACASGLAGIALAFDAVRYGKETMMLCGGADEFHILTAATFDRMNAASHATNARQASCPFDTNRNGIAVSEGAGVLFIESLESAKKRGATILAEITGYASNSSARSIAHPDSETMQACMAEALEDAHVHTHDIDYVNAHATSTPAGDAAEGNALEGLFGPQGVPVSSLKGHLGHTLGACGALESIACVRMMKEKLVLPTLHLDNPDSACGNLLHIRRNQTKSIQHCIKNAFAMGGMYYALVLSQYQD